MIVKIIKFIIGAVIKRGIGLIGNKLINTIFGGSTL